jgi:hypothetical protein
MKETPMSAKPRLRVAEPDPILDLPVPLPPIPVTVTIDEHGVVVSRDPVKVPWLFAGNIIFTIEGDDTFQNPGVTFTTPSNAPFVVSLTLDKFCVVTAVNDIAAQTVTSIGAYHYTLNLNSGKGPFRFDPTVENDSPPPPPVD